MYSVDLAIIAKLLQINKGKCIDNRKPVTTTRRIKRLVMIKHSDFLYASTDNSLKNLQLVYVSPTNRLHTKASIDIKLEGNCDNLLESDKKFVDKVFTVKSFINEYKRNDINIEHKKLAYDNTILNINLGRMASVFIKDKYIALDMYDKDNIDPNYICRDVDSKYIKRYHSYNNPYLSNMKKYKIDTDRICEVAYETARILKQQKIKLAMPSDKYRPKSIIVEKDLSVTVYEKWAPKSLLLMENTVDLHLKNFKLS